MVGDLEELKKTLKNQVDVLSRICQKTESEKKARDDRRRKIMLEELKGTLKTLHVMDSELVMDMKSEVYDKKEAIENIDEKVTSLIKSAKSSDEEDENEMRAAIKELTEQVADLNLEQFSSSLQLSVSASPDHLAKAFKQATSHVHLTSSGGELVSLQSSKKGAGDEGNFDLSKGSTVAKQKMQPLPSYGSPQCSSSIKRKSLVPDLTIGRGKSNGALPATYPASNMPNRGRRIQETDISSFSPRSQGTTSTVDGSILRKVLIDLD